MIVTHCINPPVPTRQWDWVAYIEGEEEANGPTGSGPTEAEALRDLCEQLADLEAAERERCAAWVDARRDAFCEEHGSIDPDTGTLEFGRGAHAEAKRDYVCELEEIAAGLRTLGLNV